MSANKRRFTRVPFKVQARLQLGENTYRVDEIRDISLGGCFLPLSAGTTQFPPGDIAPGRECRMEIALSGTTSQVTVEMGARIVRAEGAGLAVEFTAVAPDSLFHLQNIIRYNALDADTIDEELRNQEPPA